MSRRARSGATRRKLLIGALTATPITLLMAARASDLLAMRARLLEAGDRRASNLAAVLSGYLSQTLSSADAALRQLAIHSRRIGGATAPAAEWLDILTAARSGLGGMGSISVIDSTGIIRQSTQRSIVGQSRRDTYVFQQLLADRGDKLAANPPFRTTSTPGRPMLLPVGRRLTGRGGEFDGIVVANFQPDSLRPLFQAVDVGDEGQAAVIHLEGIVLLREPADTDAIGESVASSPLFAEIRGRKDGLLRGPVEVDGQVRRTAFRWAEPLQLLITVSLSERELLAPWQSAVRLSLSVFGGIIAATALFLTALFRQMDVRAIAEASLTSSEERFRLLASATNDAVWDWDLRTNRLWRSEGFDLLLGASRTAGDVTQPSWAASVHPDDVDRVVQDLSEAIQGGQGTWAAEYRLVREDGESAWVRDRAHIIRDTDGHATRLIGGIVDQTTKRLAEERLREQAALLDNATDAILVRALDHRIRYWNRGAELLYGWRASEVLGKSVYTVLYRDAEDFDRATREVMTHGSWAGELDQVTKDETRITVQSRWTLLRAPEGEPSAILSINTDITQRRKLEQQIFRAQRMESIGTLAGGIAHDLNNVLAPILLSIGLLKEDETDPERLELLSTIEASSQRGADMVKQVLTFARGVEGKRRVIDVRELFRDIAKIANETFLKTIQVNAVIPLDVWKVIGDATQLHQVLLNLAVNARDAMPRGGQLTLTARNIVIDDHFAGVAPEAKLGPHVQIQVEDTGTGMSREIVDRIFDPFFTTKEPGKGTGLGLSTSLAIIKSHGGFIRVYSEPDEGTTIRLYLPAAESARPDDGNEPSESLSRGNGELILVVDDETAVREVVRQTLEAFGYRVVIAADGAEATSIYASRQSEIALVITDLTMPIMDGATMIQILRQMNPPVKIIATSGLGGAGGSTRTAKSGARHFLSKPYTAESLLSTVSKVLAEGPEHVET